ncbi:MBL fold metallo-hydrolase [Streptomyces sp. NRRL S-1824]|uniref:MBL fold metallo-hydrolase n=1 Tax=Streptomyces sp. NRRL S-1824 TaxID=1463889 RepID=UPI0004CC4D6A|nr:Zn-dependent hydrolase [Streptomyces sp. NRRL S-1824]
MSAFGPTSEHVPVRVFGGPTALFEYGGLRFLTDPTFDAPGDYPRLDGRWLTKTAPSSGRPADLGRIDVVLHFHDEHPDNLDHSGRALLADVPLTLTTPGGGQRLGKGATGLSGDNASLDAVKEIAERFAPVDTAIVFAGAPRFHSLFAGACIVLDSAQAAEAATILGARRVVPVHYDSWAHFTEGREELVAAFTAAGLAARLDLG